MWLLLLIVLYNNHSWTWSHLEFFLITMNQWTMNAAVSSHPYMAHFLELKRNLVCTNCTFHAAETKKGAPFKDPVAEPAARKVLLLIMHVTGAHKYAMRWQWRWSRRSFVRPRSSRLAGEALVAGREGMGFRFRGAQSTGVKILIMAETRLRAGSFQRAFRIRCLNLVYPCGKGTRDS